jgi:iron complex outermembrane receptor protein
MDQRNTEFANGVNAKDAWNMTQGGFRMDYYPSAANTLTIQGDLYGGVENRDSLLKHTNTNGQNVLARFTHLFSERSDLKIQAYFDRTWRETPHSVTPFSYRINTYDIDIQHRFSAGRQHNIVYGLAYRLQEDRSAASLVPLSRSMPLYSGFIQDEITLFPNFLKLTIGSKILHNIYSGFETQPGARITLTADRHHTIWAAVSRAVRTPTRFDTDLIRRLIKFQSEKVIAYELGYRVRPVDRLSLSLATFYNRYHDIRSIDSNASPTVPLVLANSQRAESWGFELSGSFQAMDWWRLRGGYTYFSKNIWPTSAKVLPASVDFEGVDPRHQCLLQSMMNLPRHLELDLVARYADQLPGSTFTAHIPAYFTFDIRLAWQYKRFEISLVGQNLAKDQHIETGRSQIPRSIYGRVTCQL